MGESGAGATRGTGTLLGVLLLALASLHPSGSARAQEALGADIGDNLAAGRSATDLQSRIRLRSGYLDLDDRVSIASARLSATYAPDPRFALRLQLPFLHVDPVAPGQSSALGLGDLSTRVLARLWDHPGVTGFAGVEMFFPTASEPLLGTDHYVVAPIAALFAPLGERLAFIPVYQHFVSVAGKKNRVDINLVRVRPLVVAPLPRQWWLLLDPGFLWDLENDLDTKDTMTLGIQLGKRVGARVSAAAKPSIQVYGSEDFSWAFDVSLSILLGSPRGGRPPPRAIRAQPPRK